MSLHTQPRRRRNAVHSAPEALEARALLAGAVTSSFNNGTLKITGDSEDNGVVVSQEGSTLLVSGVNGTEVIGDAVIELGGDNVELKVIIDLKDGDDFAFVANAGDVDTIEPSFEEGSHAINSIQFKGGKGDDAFGLYESTVGGNISIKTAQGDDIVGLSASHIGGTVKIATSGGDDKVGLGPLFEEPNGTNAIGGNVDIAGDLVISTGGGNDQVGLDDVTVGDDLTIKTGGGNDDVGGTGVFVTDQLKVSLGGGDDQLYAQNSTVNGKVKINGGGGVDQGATIDVSFPEGTKEPKGFEGDAVEIDIDAFIDCFTDAFGWLFEA